jgi:hypothetical protein
MEFSENFLRADQFHSTDSPIVIHTQKDGAERFDMNSYRVQELMPIFTLMADAWRAHPSTPADPTSHSHSHSHNSSKRSHPKPNSLHSATRFSLINAYCPDINQSENQGLHRYHPLHRSLSTSTSQSIKSATMNSLRSQKSKK